MPAPLPINDFEDDFPEDGPVQLPSAWLKQPKASRSHWLHEQTRAAGFGLALGLAVVVPLVLILTGTIGEHGRFDLTAAGKSSTGKAVLAANTASLAPTTRSADDLQPSALSKPRLVSTTPMTIAPPAAEAQPQPVEARVTEAKPMETVAALAPTVIAPQVATAPAAPRDERAELVAQATARIAAGDIVAARELLGRAAASGDGAATLALAETFDPNMLAAWGAKGAAPDVGTARRLYRYAVTAGVPRAQLRLDALE